MKNKDGSWLDELLNREVTRKQFMIMMGTALVSSMGIPAALGVLKQHSNSESDQGFGSGNFGGVDL